jgi:hypothetical protein
MGNQDMPMHLTGAICPKPRKLENGIFHGIEKTHDGKRE